jgi:hypothetical protein
MKVEGSGGDGSIVQRAQAVTFCNGSGAPLDAAGWGNFLPANDVRAYGRRLIPPTRGGLTTTAAMGN